MTTTETLTANDHKAAMITFFTKHAGLTVAAAKAKIKSVIVIDKWGNTTGNSINASNVRLFYTNNANYKQGPRNDGGKGWYLSSNCASGRSEYKLSSKL